MSRAQRTVALVASLAATACLVTENPGFQLNSGSGSASTTSTASGTTGTTGTATDTAPTGTGGSASGSSGEVSTDPLLTTTQDLTTTGTTTVVPDTATTTDATTTDATTTDATTTGAPQPMTAELKHYADPMQCNLPFWCVFDEDIHKPSAAENWEAECFDAPFAPPFTVTRVGFAVFGSKGDPDASLEFHAYDMGAQAPVMKPFHVRALGFIASAGHHDFTLNPPVVVDAQRFCISVHSGLKLGSQLGLGLGLGPDNVLTPPGQTFVGINGPPGCNVGKFTDLSTIVKSLKTQWCIDATISKAP